MHRVICAIDSPPRTLARLLATALVVLSASAAVSAPAAQAEGSPDVVVGASSDVVLFGERANVTLDASNPAGQPLGYNLSYRAVLPADTSYVIGSANVLPTRTLHDQPTPGETTLVWRNVADLSPFSDFRLDFQVEHSSSAFDIGDSFDVDAGAYLSTDPSEVPQFDVATGAPSPASYTGSDTDTGPQSIEAIRIEGSGGGPLLRGLHDHQANYAITASNSSVGSTTNGELVTHLPAGVEYLGCGGPDSDNTTDAAGNLGSTEEYPGAGEIVVPSVPGCVEPESVETVTADLDGPDGLPEAVYTRLQWSLGTLGPGEDVARPFRVAIPQRENTDIWTTAGSAPTPASLGQAANLDNNSGPEIEDGQELQVLSEVTGQYGGALPVSSVSTMASTAEDLLETVASSSGALAQGALTNWTLTFRTGEYRYSHDVTVTGRVPNGLCPLGALNYSSPMDPQCAPVGGQEPSVPYSSVSANSDGTFTVAWEPGALPELGHADVNDTWTIVFPTRTRSVYQVTGQPIAAPDSILTSSALTGVASPRCLPPEQPSCAGALPEAATIDHDEPLDRLMSDAGSAGQTAAGPVLDARIAATGSDCATASYVQGPSVSYEPGDRICWQLRADFPAFADTRIDDIHSSLPDDTGYETGSDAAGSDNTVAAILDDGGASEGSLLWEISGGDTVPAGGQLFRRTISSIFVPEGQLAPGRVPGNVIKAGYEGTSGRAFSVRDQADFELALPQIDVEKRVFRVDGSPAGGNPPGTTDLVVAAGDEVEFRVDVSNTGPVDAVDAEVWDLLPDELDCAAATIGDGGQCVDGGAGADRILWTGVAIAQSASKALIYEITVPSGIELGEALVNRAGVRTFQSESNVGTRFTYTPSDNVDASISPEEWNVPAAEGEARVFIGNVSLQKAVSTSIDQTGNDAASQATIGETIAHTTEMRIPEGTTLGGTAELSDAVQGPNQVLVAASASATLNGGPLPGGFSLTEGAGSVTVDFPADYENPDGDDTVVLTFSTRVADVAANSRSPLTTLTGQATATWTDDGSPQTRNSNTTSVQVVEPNLTQAKTSDNGSARVSPGQLVSYALTTTNADAARVSTANDTAIVDTLPAGLTPVDAIGDPLSDGASVPPVSGGNGDATWNATARTITRSASTIAPGSGVVTTYRARVEDGVGGSARTNTVTASGTSAPDAAVGERASGSGYAPTADRSVTLIGAAVAAKTVTPTTATVGAPVDHVVDLTIPAGIELRDATAIDTLPDSIDFDGYASAACTAGCGPAIAVQPYDPVVNGDGTTTVAWDLGDVAAHSSDRTVRLTYDGHVRSTHRSGGAPVVRGQTAVGATRAYSNLTDELPPFDPESIPSPAGFDEISAQSTATVTVSEPTVTVSKQARVRRDGVFGSWVDSATVQAGDDLEYRIVVSNPSGADKGSAYDVEVTDEPDVELADVVLDAGASTDLNTEGWSSGDRAMGWTIPEIAPGASVTLSYSADLAPVSGLSDGQAVANTAAVPHYFGIPAADRAANPAWAFRDYSDGGSDSVTATLDFPSLTAQKTTGRAGFPESANVEVGEAFPWRIEIANTSTGASAESISIRDVLPPNWSYVEDSALLTPPGGPAVAIEPAQSGSPATGYTLDWSTAADLAPGQSATLTFDATPALAALLDAPGPGTQTNTARAAGRITPATRGTRTAPTRARTTRRRPACSPRT